MLRPLPDPLPLGPFAFARATEVGVPRSRLRLPDVAHPHHGIYDTNAEAGDLVRRCEQILMLLGPHRCFSHLTAARLWQMPVPLRYEDDEPLHVVSWSGRPRIRRPGVTGWRSDDVLPRVKLGALPVVAPAEVWCQLAVPGALGRDRETGPARALDMRRLVAVADHLMTGPFSPTGTRRPQATRAELLAAIVRRSGGRGTSSLRAALDIARSPVHSAKETELRLLLVDHGLPEPQVQVPVETAAGLRHADLGYPDARVLIEYQGDHHRTDRRQWRMDLTRGQLFEDAGYRVLVVTDDDLATPRELVARVRRALSGTTFRA